MVTALSVFAALFIGAQSPEKPASDHTPCAFGLLQRVGQAEVIGSPELRSRTLVLEQPDSPLAILRVDVSDLKLNLGGPTHDHEGQFRIQVQNVSNRVVKDATIMLRYWSGRGGGGSGPAWKQPLAPAAVVWLSGNSRGSGVRLGEGMETGLELRLVVESVEIEGCVYKPAQAHRITGPPSS
jgi:hypothetical protein